MNNIQKLADLIISNSDPRFGFIISARLKGTITHKTGRAFDITSSYFAETANSPNPFLWMKPLAYSYFAKLIESILMSHFDTLGPLAVDVIVEDNHYHVHDRLVRPDMSAHKKVYSSNLVDVFIQPSVFNLYVNDNVDKNMLIQGSAIKDLPSRRTIQ